MRLGWSVSGRCNVCRTTSGTLLDGSPCMATQVARKSMSGIVQDRPREVKLVAVLYGLRVGVSGLLMIIRLCSGWRMGSPR